MDGTPQPFKLILPTYVSDWICYWLNNIHHDSLSFTLQVSWRYIRGWNSAENEHREKILFPLNLINQKLGVIICYLCSFVIYREIRSETEKHFVSNSHNHINTNHYRIWLRMIIAFVLYAHLMFTPSIWPWQI